jgi:hypothetical protein
VICIGCGCDEHHACTLPGGATCAWIHVGPRGLAGICSACTEIFSALSIEEELRIAESAIAEADAEDQAVEDAPPAFSFMEPDRPRLILPGDEEFHL